VRRLAPLLSIFAPTALACSSAADDAPTLCQVAEHTYAYAGRTLSLEGLLYVSRHGSSLSDPRCGRGLSLSWNDGVLALSEFDAVVDRSMWEPLIVRVRVTGRIQREHERGWLGLRVWQFAIADAELLSVDPILDVDVDRYLSWFQGPSPEPFQPSRFYPPAIRDPTAAEAQRIGRECGVRVRRARMPNGLRRLAPWGVYEPVDATPEQSECFYHHIRLLIAQPAPA
jgi:hypothetical protein